jgi:hypothetical protein
MNLPLAMEGAKAIGAGHSGSTQLNEKGAIII